jgi:hypothetical protein
LSFRAVTGQVHRPFPMYGVSWGAILTEAIQWSVGMVLAFMFQSKVCVIIPFPVYILSNLDLIGLWFVVVQ